MAEWSNAAVLKTVEGHTSGGSNPSLSARVKPNTQCWAFSLRPIRTQVRDGEPGDKVIVPPPNNLEEMDARIADTSCDKIDFYLAKKQLQSFVY